MFAKNDDLKKNDELKKLISPVCIQRYLHFLKGSSFSDNLFMRYDAFDALRHCECQGNGAGLRKATYGKNYHGGSISKAILEGANNELLYHFLQLFHMVAFFQMLKK